MTSRLALSVLAMLIIGVPIDSFAQDWDWEGLPKPRPAFTIEISRSMSNGAGEKLGGAQRILEAYKSDGSWIVAGQNMPGTFVVHSIFSAKDQSYTELHHDVKAKSTTYESPDFHGLLAPRDPTCEAIHPYTELVIGSETVSSTESVSKDVFLGFPVVKHLTQRSNGNTYESWQAPDLGCKEIFMRDTRKDVEPEAFYVSEVSATKIELGEPVPELFEIPADYTEEPPSQIRIIRFAKKGWTMTDAVKESLRHRDEQYWSSQVYKPIR